MHRSLAPTPPSFASAGPVRAPRATDVVVSLVPSAAYLVAHPVLGAVGAMLVASGTSLAVAVVRHRAGRSIGVLVPATLGFLALRTLVGALTGSEVAYFGMGLALSAGVALAVAATAWTRTPAASHLLPLVAPYRHLRPDHPLYRRVSAHVTLAWAAAELVATVLEARHLVHASGSAFLLGRTTVALPAMAGVVFVLIFYVRARLDPLEHHLAHRHAATPPGAAQGVPGNV